MGTIHIGVALAIAAHAVAAVEVWVPFLGTTHRRVCMDTGPGQAAEVALFENGSRLRFRWLPIGVAMPFRQ